MMEGTAPVGTSSRCLANLGALASAIDAATELVSLQAVLGALIRRFRLPRRVVAAELLSELSGASRDVTVYVLSSPPGAPPRFDPAVDLQERGSGAEPRWWRMSVARSRPGDTPCRGEILAALHARWVEEEAGVPVALEEFASISCADATSKFEHISAPLPMVREAVVVGSLGVASNDPATAPAREAGREVSGVDLVKGSPRYDQACMALFRERQRLEGTHRPMRALVHKYELSDGKLRACIRHGEKLCEPEVDGSLASVFRFAEAHRSDASGAKHHRLRA
jgi:hypothetical protein